MTSLYSESNLRAVPVIHHTALCVRDVEASLRFWRDGLGFQPLMDERFEGDWPTLLRAPGRDLRSVFLGDPDQPTAGIIELVDLGDVDQPPPDAGRATTGFLLVSLTAPLDATLDRLAELGLGGDPRRIEVHGVAMAVVLDPDGVPVELIDTGAAADLDRLTGA
jgi:catechol 2,3-dioxygenase-like lactoylglutathione lyase family enzyme